MILVPRPPPRQDGVWRDPYLRSSVSLCGDSAAPYADATLLLQAGMTLPDCNRTMAAAAHWGVEPVEAALALGCLDPSALIAALGRMAGIGAAAPFAYLQLRRLSPTPEPYRLLRSMQPLPLANTPAFVLNAQSLTAGRLVTLGSMLGPARDRLLLVDRRALGDAVAATYREPLAAEAADGLRHRRPRFSAASGIRRWQLGFLAAVLGIFMGAAVFAPRETMVVYAAVLSLVFLLTITIRVVAAVHAGYRRAVRRTARSAPMANADLPRYTILVALYHEACVLSGLVESLKRLDYPPPKLDIKLLLEEDDAETIAAARAAELPPHFEILIVPHGSPRTKPRALNYGLQFATGDYLVIFDAEDRPVPSQLRKAAARFRDAPPEVVCVQARLIFDNYAENWLSKQFTIEYASHFAGILPMLDAARLPIPLGGTSNHFRIEALRRAGGWDPYNVTEDADLGMRLYRCGLRSEVLDSTTYEEAACHPRNWLRQRTRWLKGWLQTYLVHMRQPSRLLAELGLPGFLAFQGHFAGVLIAALVHPLSYVLVIHDALSGVLMREAETAAGRNLWLIAAFNMAAGYASSLALGYFVLRGRKVKQLIPQLVFIPVYWLFISAAAYRAVWQFIRAPQRWEKTEHGLTKHRRYQSWLPYS